MAKSIRVDEKTYMKLCEHAGKLQAGLKRPVSIDETIRHLIKISEPTNRITDLAGAWRVTEDEVLKIEQSLRKGWQGWKPRSA